LVVNFIVLVMHGHINIKLKYNNVTVKCYTLQEICTKDKHTYIHKPSRYFQHSYSHFIHSVVSWGPQPLPKGVIHHWETKRTTTLLHQQKPLHTTEQIHFHNYHETPVEPVARVSHVTAGEPHSWLGGDPTPQSHVWEAENCLARHFWTPKFPYHLYKHPQMVPIPKSNESHLHQDINISLTFIWNSSALFPSLLQAFHNICDKEA